MYGAVAGEMGITAGLRDGCAMVEAGWRRVSLISCIHCGSVEVCEVVLCTPAPADSVRARPPV